MQFVDRRAVAEALSLQRSPTSVIDFYFDPESHLLTKSATMIRLPGQGIEEFLRILSYGNYQNVQGALVPLQIKESLNGEPQWVLTLTQVQLTSDIDSSEFAF